MFGVHPYGTAYYGQGPIGSAVTSVLEQVGHFTPLLTATGDYQPTLAATGEFCPVLEDQGEFDDGA